MTELRERELGKLEDAFGRYGLRLCELARGIDENPVVPDRPTKSISVEDTFEQDILLTETEAMIRNLAEKLWSASRNRITFGTHGGPQIETSEIKILHAQSYARFSSLFLRGIDGHCLEASRKSGPWSNERYRLVGVVMNNFRKAEQTTAQPPLFE